MVSTLILSLIAVNNFFFNTRKPLLDMAYYWKRVNILDNRLTLVIISIDIFLLITIFAEIKQGGYRVR